MAGSHDRSPSPTRLWALDAVPPTQDTGGMAAVHRARDTELDRAVAVNPMNAVVAADPQSRERFRREVRAVAGINHPNVVAIHDVGEEELATGSIPYLVMEHLDGKPPAEWLPPAPGEMPPCRRRARLS